MSSNNGRYHVVQPGETLWLIAQKYGVSVDLLVAANPRINPQLIFPGQSIYIPGRFPGS
ncbi:LysM domain-containing protein [Pleurocapsa sp. PCC 7319]|uniref:LysM peptidoglycan-binding domain-containing protein n=1 Tax=Pleurocapsa sp. PCC 7319 TaxID=118161 RepID=UPI0003499E29|nr:LysM domain-containing protein [Pleurocapsa sp. PCC 7319]